MTANEMKYDFLAQLEGQFQMTSPAFDDRRISRILTMSQREVFLKDYNPMGNKYQKGFEFDEIRRRDLSNLVSTLKSTPSVETGTSLYTGECVETSPVIKNITNMDGLAIGTYIYDQNNLVGLRKIIDIVSENSIVLDNPSGITTGTYVFYGGLGKSRSQVGAKDNGVFLDLPHGFLYPINEGIKSSLEPDKYATVLPIGHDEYYANIDNPYKKPYKNLMWRLNVASTFNPLNDSYQDNIIDTEQASTLFDLYPRIEIIKPATANLTTYLVRYLRMPRAIVIDTITESNQVNCELDPMIHDKIIAVAVRKAIASMKPEEYQIRQSEEQSSE